MRYQHHINFPFTSCQQRHGISGMSDSSINKIKKQIKHYGVLIRKTVEAKFDSYIPLTIYQHNLHGIHEHMVECEVYLRRQIHTYKQRNVH